MGKREPMKEAVSDGADTEFSPHKEHAAQVARALTLCARRRHSARGVASLERRDTYSKYARSRVMGEQQQSLWRLYAELASIKGPCSNALRDCAHRPYACGRRKYHFRSVTHHQNCAQRLHESLLTSHSPKNGCQISNSQLRGAFF